MSLTPEQAQMKGIADQMAGNSLSSVWIDQKTNGTTFGVKVYHEDANEAHRIAEAIYTKLQESHP